MVEPVRCNKCGAWMMEGLTCSVCEKINALSVQDITQQQSNTKAVQLITYIYVMSAVMNGVKAMVETGYDQTWSETDDLKIMCTYMWHRSHLTQ